jgi:hypothetical protein
MKRCLVLALVLRVAVSAHASGSWAGEFILDFTDPNSVCENELIWSPQDKVKQTDKGLLFSSQSLNAYIDFELMTKPYAIGLSWRPTSAVRVDVDLTPVGEEMLYGRMTLNPSFYRLYVRYSPDLTHWSSWHALQNLHTDRQAEKEAGKHQFRLQLQVPQKERKAYTDYLYQYMRMDVPWQSDEEAMAEWILSKEPDFFARHIPFIGYIQFLCEASMRANLPLAEMKIGYSWVVGGLHMPPKDPTVSQGRDFIPWRYKAPDAKPLP